MTFVIRARCGEIRRDFLRPQGIYGAHFNPLSLTCSATRATRENSPPSPCSPCKAAQSCEPNAFSPEPLMLRCIRPAAFYYIRSRENMKIKGIDGLTNDQVQAELDR